MANIVVTGGNPKRKEWVQSLTAFALSKLVSKRLDNRLTIKVQLLKGLIDNNSVFGDCIYLDECNGRPREFLIRVDNSLRLRTLLTTIAHELVHVKQWATGEMWEYSAIHSTTRWKQKKIRTDKTDYWDLPWEIEAHGREIGLFVRWCESEKIGHLKWTQEVY